MQMTANHKLKRYNDVSELIASKDNPTPIVKLSRINPHKGLELFLKLEWYNPFGSIKDRAAKFLLQGLKDKGLLDGKQIVEPSSGNTGIALVALANLLGVKTTITIPDAVPQEKQNVLRLLGAQVWPTPDSLCPIKHPKDGAIALAYSFVESERTKDQYVMPNQYENPDNVKAHYETTGPEIWAQTEGKIKYFIAGYGTCGTITGVGRFLKEQNPDIKVIGVFPQKNHRIPGMKNFEESKKPIILDEDVVDESITVPDDPAYRMSIRLAREESLIVGPSTGAIIQAALEYTKDKQGIAVAVSPDSGFKYMSFFDDYVKNDGRPPTGLP
jgi:cysteine synthase A/cysteine synthase B